MNLKEIRKLASRTGIAGFFKEMYNYSIKALDTLSEDEIKDIFSDKVYNDGTYGRTCSLFFRNDGKNKTCIGTTEEAGDGNPLNCQYCCVDSSFDYRNFKMTLYFDERENIVSFDADVYAETVNFCRPLADDDFLHTVFGKYHVDNDSKVDSYISFDVSTEFFEDEE